MTLRRPLRPLAAVALAAALFASGAASLHGQLAGRPAGPVAPEAPDAQEVFLKKGEVVDARQLGKGVTNPWRLTLEHGGLRHDGAFQDVDKTKDEVRFRSGRVEQRFRDYYGYNIAAYRLARLLGYDDLVPPSVERSWKGRRGALTWWVNKKWDEDERQKEGVKPPDQAAWERQLYLARAFTALVDDSDRNLGNQLVTADFRIWLIDFTRAFRLAKEPKNPALLRRIDHRFFARLKAVTDQELHAAVSPWVDGPERAAMIARRAAIVRHYEAIAAERGDGLVFYDMPVESARSKE